MNSTRNISVTKRDGSREPLDLDKFHKVVFWACEGLKGVSASEVEIRSHVQFYDGIPTSDIQETLIKAAADLISEESPAYQYVAGRLVNYHLRKNIYGSFTPPPLLDVVRTNVNKGAYDAELLTVYTDEEWETIASFIDHERDMTFTYAAMEQLRGKYLIRNRVTGEFFETPQIAYAVMSAILFSKYPRETRLQWVKDFYDAISQFVISLPTPIMGGLRTPQRQFSSCVVIAAGDSLDSINAASSAVVKYVSQRAGIGLDVGRIRAIDSPVRNGEVKHTGIIPFIKHFQTAVKSCSQGGIRGGAATLYYPLWHLEVEDLLVLKNNKGIEETRVRHLDYGVQFNKVMYERLLSGGNITLFSPHDVPEMYDAYFVDVDKFRRLYEEAEANPAIRKKTLRAADLFGAFMQERKDTGRIYLINVDHANDHGAFLKDKAVITQSNLCAEILLPSQPLKHIFDDEHDLSLCTLAAINIGAIKTTSDFEKPCMLAVRALNELLDYQDYPVLAAERSTMKRRPLGVGIINLAYWLAKNGLSYQNISDDGLALVHEWMEAWSYYLIKASVDLARERGACPGSDETKYSQGIFPIDTYKRDVDALTAPTYRCDWDTLREEARAHGIFNSTLMACMPSEASSLVSNSTNGIEPPRALVSVKQSKDGVVRQVVPGSKRLKSHYDLLWAQRSPEGYLKIMAVINKFVDQSLSTNISYNPAFYPDEKLPLSEMLGHILLWYRWGGRTLYYNNVLDGQSEIDVETFGQTEVIAAADAPTATDAEDCDSCKI